MRIALLGDIAPFGRYCVHHYPEVVRQIEGLAHFLRGHDLVIGNLETPFVDGEKPVGYKSAHISAHPANVRLLEYLGVTHVCLANNHIADYGEPAFERTVRTLDQSGISWFGVAGRDLRIELKGERIGLVGYCSLNTNPSLFGKTSRQEVNLLDIDKVITALERNQDDGVLTILSVHSGEEHVQFPSSDDVAFARALAARFHFIYYGHHPHVVQGFETVAGSPLLYSLGNLIFDDVYTPRSKSQPLISLTEANRTGAVASMEVVDQRVCETRLTPIYLGKERVLIGDEVTTFEIKPLNDALTEAGLLAYEKTRQAVISARLRGRRASRDLAWYLCRLNLNSLGILYRARKNGRRHFDLFTSKLSALR